MNLLKNISFRSCCYCGASARQDSLLCESCWIVLHKLKNPKIISNYNCLPFPIFYLFDWVPDQCPLLNALLVCMKNPETNLFHKAFAELLAYERGHLQNPLFIPVPPTQEGNKDHSGYLAEETARLYQRKPENFLLWQNKEGKQRKKSKKDRAKGKMIRRGVPKKTFKNQIVILVDDIVTTGATAIKAYEALGSPKAFELWCLACRKPSALV